MKINNKNISKVLLKNSNLDMPTDVIGIFLSNKHVWPEIKSLKFSTTGSSTIQMKKRGSESDSLPEPTFSFEYSTDNGVTYTPYVFGDVISFTSDQPLFLRASSRNETINISDISDDDRVGSINNKYYGFVLTGDNVSISGNLQSLLSKYANIKNVPDFCFAKLFYSQDSIVDVSELELTASKLGHGSYLGLFENCDNITTIPNNFPAIELSERSYNWMFSSCKNLTNPIEVTFYSKNYVTNCYYQMFYNCGKSTATIINGRPVFIYNSEYIINFPNFTVAEIQEKNLTETDEESEYIFGSFKKVTFNCKDGSFIVNGPNHN